MLTQDEIFSQLDKLLQARGPSGQEDEVREIVFSFMKPYCDEIWLDPIGNLIGKVQGKNPHRDPLRFMTHMDEIAMIVKRVQDDGTLRVDPLGGMLPAIFGQGLVEILGNHHLLLGVFSQGGSAHTTTETQAINKIMPKDKGGKAEAVLWEDCYVITRKTAQELKAMGIRPGTRVVVAKARRRLHQVGDAWAGYFMDNRAPLLASLLTLKNIRDEEIVPECDLYFVATTTEEIGCDGASFASRTLPGDVTLAIDVGPVAKEYQSTLTASPIIVYKDALTTYDKKLSDQLFQIGERIELNPTAAIFGSYGSDSSFAKRHGQSARSLLVTIPCENTHGFEMIHEKGIELTTKLLSEFIVEYGKRER